MIYFRREGELIRPGLNFTWVRGRGIGPIVHLRFRNNGWRLRVRPRIKPRLMLDWQHR